ncbi:MAG: hypothetical protein R3E84_00175 [Pseudomonadales bacterium]
MDHHTQPFVWSEVHRYGLATESMPSPDAAVARLGDNGLVPATPEEMGAMLQALATLAEQTRAVIPVAYQHLLVDNPSKTVHSLRLWTRWTCLHPFARWWTGTW